MHRLLERLDSAASTVVPLAYLAGMLLATAAYFSGLVLDAGVAVGLALAVAVELHGFLEQRRVRALWATHSRSQNDEQITSQLRAHVAILSALVAFQAYNGLQFLGATWRPAPGIVPQWAQLIIRALVLPAAFLVSGALSPLTVDAGDELRHAARQMLHKALGATLRQWQQRIQRARTQGVDLAPVVVSLLQDAGDVDGARRVQLIADGLRAAEDTSTYPALSTRSESPRSASQGQLPPERPPTGPGTPSAADASKRGEPGRERRGREQTITLVEPPEWRRKRPRTASAERRVRRVLAAQPSISTRMLAKQAKVSDSTASKYRRVWDTEQRGQLAQ